MQMPNYGGNTNTSNPNKPVITTTTNPSTAKSNTPKEKPAVKAVASGKVSKANVIKKAGSAIIAEDGGTVKNYILTQVIIPTLKKTLVDIVQNGISILVYGTATGFNRPLNGYGNSWNNQSNGYFNNIYARPNTYMSYGSGPRPAQQVPMNTTGLNDIVFETQGDAEAVLSLMNEILAEYGRVSIADYYSASGQPASNYTDNNFGWTDLYDARVIRSYSGWQVRLPRPRPIV